MFFLKTEQNRAILMKFLTCRVSVECTGEFLQNNVFPPLLAAILNFCVKRKNTCISEVEQYRAIAMTFLTHRVPAESIKDFS